MIHRTAQPETPAPAMGIARGARYLARHCFTLACLQVLAALTAPAMAAEPLSLSQLDQITAGRVTATASSLADAIAPAARTSASTETIARTKRMPSVTLRRVRDDLVVAETVEEREAEIAFASARAKASGTDPNASCNARIAFSGQPSLRLVETSRVSQPDRAACLCAKFGVFVRPN